jgi:hypothetical protein
MSRNPVNAFVLRKVGCHWVWSLAPAGGFEMGGATSIIRIPSANDARLFSTSSMQGAALAAPFRIK